MGELDVGEVLAALPHRPPFLLVDRIVEISDDGTRIVGIKAVGANEPYLAGHFPGYPIMPGVLIAEALAQTGGVLIGRNPANRDKLGLLAGLDGFRFKRPVRPGDTLRLEVTLTRLRMGVGRMTGRALVGDEVAAEGEITFFLAPIADLPGAEALQRERAGGER